MRIIGIQKTQAVPFPLVIRCTNCPQIYWIPGIPRIRLFHLGVVSHVSNCRLLWYLSREWGGENVKFFTLKLRHFLSVLVSQNRWDWASIGSISGQAQASRASWAPPPPVALMTNNELFTFCDKTLPKNCSKHHQQTYRRSCGISVSLSRIYALKDQLAWCSANHPLLLQFICIFSKLWI